MTDEDVHEFDLIEEENLDPDMVCRIIEKCNEPRDSNYDVAKDVAEILDIDEIDAEDLVERWREPDWPVEYEQTFRVDDVDVYEHFQLQHRGYEPHFARDFENLYVTWRVNKYTHGAYKTTEYSVELVEVNGVRMDGDENG